MSAYFLHYLILPKRKHKVPGTEEKQLLFLGHSGSNHPTYQPYCSNYIKPILFSLSLIFSLNLLWISSQLGGHCICSQSSSSFISLFKTFLRHKQYRKPQTHFTQEVAELRQLVKVIQLIKIEQTRYLSAHQTLRKGQKLWMSTSWFTMKLRRNLRSI